MSTVEKQYVAVYQFTTEEVDYFYLSAPNATEAKQYALAKLNGKDLLHIEQSETLGSLVRNRYLKEERLEA